MNLVPFSVVLPVFDEAVGLAETLDELQAVLRRLGRDCEIVVVDDGSTDATPDILAYYADIRVLRHADNRGYGAALKAGIRAARHPLIVIMDADGTYAPNDLPALIDRCATADMVVGARTGLHVTSAPVRSAVKWCFRVFARWITDMHIPDLNSGLRVFHRRVAERFMTVLPDGFSFTTTITVGSILERLVVYFEPVDYRLRKGRSKIRPVRDTLRIGRQLLRLGIRFAPFRTAVALALPFFVAFVASSLHHIVRRSGVLSTDWLWLIAGIIALGAGLRAEHRLRQQRVLDATVVAPRES